MVLTVVFLIILDVKEDVESVKNVSKCRIRDRCGFPSLISDSMENPRKEMQNEATHGIGN